MPPSDWRSSFSSRCIGARANIFCAEDREKVRGFARKLAITLGCCVVFFVAVPLVIYYYSYYWQMLPLDGD